MKIAVVHDTVYPFFKGGSQKRAYEIARRLVQKGHDVSWYGMDYGVKEIAGIRLHAVSPAYTLYNESGRRTISQALKYALKLNIRERVDVIDCTNFPYLHCFRAKEATIRQHIPLVIMWFEFWGKYWYKYMGPLGLAGMTIEKMVTLLPTAVISDSEKVKQQLVGAGIKESKIRVIPDGVDLEVIASVKPSREKHDVLYVGRILTHKNVEVLVSAVAGMKDVKATIIGTGQNKEACERMARELGAEKRIKFLGHVEKDEDVYAAMKSAKVLVLPSVQEGHPHVLPEANACGIPVITIKGTCDEFIDHGRNGYIILLHEGSMQSWIRRALELYPKFKKPCIEDAKRYDWNILADATEKLYKELI